MSRLSADRNLGRLPNHVLAAIACVLAAFASQVPAASEAHYLGDSTHAVSTSPAVTVTVTADVTATALVASPTSGPVGTAILMISTLTSGTHSITTTYTGDSTEKSSKSSVVAVTIT
jgi:hypothetical protein